MMTTDLEPTKQSKPRARAVKFTQAKRQAYLDALRLGAMRGKAAERAGVVRQTVMYHRQRDPEFAQAEAEAELAAHEDVEAALRARAVSGRSDVALIFWLTNRLPERWQDRRNLHMAGPSGGPLEVEVRSVDRIERFVELLGLLAGQVGERVRGVGTSADVVGLLAAGGDAVSEAEPLPVELGP